MGNAVVLTVVLALAGAPAEGGQAPTGAVAGVVTDSSGGVLSGARITIVNRETGHSRTVVTAADGSFTADVLPPGLYELTAEAAGFKRLKRDASVNAGRTTTADLTLEVGEVSDTVVVSGASPLLHADAHHIEGVVGRDQIDRLPLNGRNFLDLAKLEPGVTNVVRGTNNRSFVPVLGAGLQTTPRIGYTRVTADGGDITFLGTIGSGIQVSQDVVQEFQISTANFDASTGLTSNGAVNIVTRSGSTSYHGDAFFSYRDHNLSAYPGLKRDPRNPDPFFERRQFGASVGGPIWGVRRAVFFASYERNDQDGVQSVQPTQFPALGGVFPTPYRGTLYSARADVRLSDRHNAFVRFTRDANRSFAPNGGPGSLIFLPSAWSHLTNEVNQTLAAVTSVLSPTLVNDLRLSYFSINSPETPASPADCGATAACIGLGGPNITVQGNLVIGDARTLAFQGGRFEASESLVWQRGAHGLRVGVDWEHSSNSASMIDNATAVMTLASPQQAKARGIPVLASYTTVGDLLTLPVLNIQTGVGPGAVPQRNFGPNRIIDTWRLFAADTWRAGSRVTVNAALGWSYEPNALNVDLTKPALLVAILGAGGLTPPTVRYTNFSPMLGFAWTATADGKTIVRGGAGRYYDSLGQTNAADLAAERQSLLPLGTGRLTTSKTYLITSGVTGADALASLGAIRAPLEAVLNPDNRDFSLRNLNLTKQSASLFDPGYQTPYAVHVGVGVQREIAGNVVVSADIVWRRFVHTSISGIDYNRYIPGGSAVIPRCVSDAQRNDPNATCSTGPMLFTNSSGWARYTGLLVRAEKRLSHGTQLLASYALSSYIGTNGTGPGTGFNNNNWSENVGPLPTDIRHVLNVSGLADLPWRIQAALSVSVYSRPPFSAYVGNADFNGDGTRNDLLPGSTVNQFGRGLDQSDLAALVQQYNQQHTPRLILPAAYSFNDDFFTADLRLTRTFPLGLGTARLDLIGEGFNLLNTANLVQYGGDLTVPSTFGQPSARFSQIFGSGGPRAFQLGARITF